MRIFRENGKREVGCNRWASAQDVPRPAGIRDRRNERRKGEPTSRQSVTSMARSEASELGTIGLLLIRQQGVSRCRPGSRAAQKRLQPFSCPLDQPRGN